MAIGNGAAYNTQGGSAVAIGKLAGSNYQGTNAVSIGNQAGYNTQGNSAVSIGNVAGYNFQQESAVSIGNGAGLNYQQAFAVSIGNQAGYNTQGNSAVAIGNKAGNQCQGANAIAIGNLAGPTNQLANSIVLNASGTALNSTTQGFYVAPVQSSTTNYPTLMYSSSEKQVYVSDSKTFVIPHPLDSNRYLVHGCLEGPDGGGVYYRGEGFIPEHNQNSVVIQLPDYVDALANQFTVQVTPIQDDNTPIHANINIKTGRVKDGAFTVYGPPNTAFFWLVHGNRRDVHIQVEPWVSSMRVKGDGPYKWVEPNPPTKR